MSTSMKGSSSLCSSRVFVGRACHLRLRSHRDFQRCWVAASFAPSLAGSPHHQQYRLFSSSRPKKGRLSYELSPAEKHAAQHLIDAFDSPTRNVAEQVEGATGLYGIPSLRRAEDWERLAKHSASRISQLIEQVASQTLHYQRFVRACFFFSSSLSRSNSISNQRSPSLTGKVAILRTLDTISSSFCGVVDPAELCRSTHPDAGFVSAAESCYDVLSSVIHNLNTNPKLYEAVSAVCANHSQSSYDDLTEEQRIVARQLKLEFELNGIHLSEAQRNQVVALQEKLTTLSYTFSNIANNVKGAEPNHAYVTLSSSDLEGIPSSYNIQKGKTIRLTNTSNLVPVILQHARKGQVRQKVYQMANSHPPQSLRVLDELLATRHELATLLNFPSFAELTLANKLARKQQNVLRFLTNFVPHLFGKAEKELELMRAKKREMETGKDDRIYAWDKEYYSRLCLPHSPKLKEYFSLGSCIAGLNTIITRLFGARLEMVPISAPEQWHPTVRKLRLWHETEGLLGYVYMDLFSRDGKFNNPANFAINFSHEIRKQDLLSSHTTSTTNDNNHNLIFFPDDHGGDVVRTVPKVALVCAFPSPSDGRPALLRHSDVVTLFHEFGHTLASLLSRTQFQHGAGTRAALDFVETPSTLFEQYAHSHAVLRLFARHYRTGQEIREEDLDAIKVRLSFLLFLFRLLFSSLLLVSFSLFSLLFAHRNKQQTSNETFSGLDAQMQVLHAIIDQVYHGPHPLPSSTTSLLADLQNRYTSVPFAEGTAWQAGFGHLSGYGAGYYSYLQCRVFSANLWEGCFAADPLSRAVGGRLREEVLRWGGAKEPMTMMKAFLPRDEERDPLSIDAYLKMLGCKGERN
ncbi:Mitochondrial intermediate peptidase [Balamuthia mandrillaris]